MPNDQSPRISARRRVETVGQVGQLQLTYARQGHKTVMTSSHCTSPWHLVPPIYLDDSGAAYTLLLNPSGGLVGGDHLSIDMTVGPDAHVLVSAPSANRVYRSVSEISSQVVNITVGTGAILEWVPEPTIPFAGSRFRQTIRVNLAAGATVLLWDAIASGRIARGERWKFASLQNEVRIGVSTGNSLLERYDLDCGAEVDRIGLAGAWNYVASFYLIGDMVSQETWKRIEAEINVLLDTEQGVLQAGVSEPAIPGLVVRVVAMRATELVRMFEGLWTIARRELWDRPMPALRRY